MNRLREVFNKDFGTTDVRFGYRLLALGHFLQEYDQS